MAFQLDRDRQRRILGVVQKFFGGALGNRRERAQFLGQPVGGRFQFGVRHAFGGHTPGAGGEVEWVAHSKILVVEARDDAVDVEFTGH